MKKAKFFIMVIVAMVMITGCTSCKPDPIIILPSVTSSSASDVTRTSAVLRGAVTADGGGTIISRGFYFYDGAEIILIAGSGLGDFDYSLNNLEPNKSYQYKAFAVNEAGEKTGFMANFKTEANRPVIIETKESTDLTTNSVISGGSISDVGDNVLVERGLVYNTAKAPTTENVKIVYNGNEADYSFSLNNLEENTKYYARAYAINDANEIFYGNEVQIWTYALIDIDGNGYHAVTIGSQVWTVENFKSTHYRNGDEIPEVTENSAWSRDQGITTGARCYYDNDRASYEPVYGCLYNWYAAVDLRNLAPDGWHVSSDEEWTKLKNFLGGDAAGAGGKIKEAGTVHWKEPNNSATNSSGFTALPGGVRGDRVDGEGVFGDITTDGIFWSTTQAPIGAWAKFVSYNYIYLFSNQAFPKAYGMSIRLIKD